MVTPMPTPELMRMPMRVPLPQVMNSVNPRFILRQHVAARVIERAEMNDLAEMKRVLELLRRPHEEHGYVMSEKYAAVPPDWSRDLLFD